LNNLLSCVLLASKEALSFETNQIKTLDRRLINGSIGTTAMDIRLSLYDRSLLAGEHSPAAQLAMRIITRMAQVYGASELLDISGTY
jgi:hypothetical protein